MKCLLYMHIFPAGKKGRFILTLAIKLYAANTALEASIFIKN